jgi:hypothetical protein
LRGDLSVKTIDDWNGRIGWIVGERAEVRLVRRVRGVRDKRNIPKDKVRQQFRQRKALRTNGRRK